MGSGDRGRCGRPARGLAGEGWPQPGLGSGGGRSAAQVRACPRSGVSSVMPGVYAASCGKEEEWCCGTPGWGLWSVSRPGAWRGPVRRGAEPVLLSSVAANGGPNLEE
ncbi:hypothetical protein NDU88_003439 [Pleurodeles waltl]|uniref:Uncharacterized protein n=1 Tax=Pleurodeles waltl TaxID=8319 RepID=A0AAV7WSC9_PLEWA|nr:hypothetical protein NDU88_003439 [Pleurodeles waltl]